MKEQEEVMQSKEDELLEMKRAHGKEVAALKESHTSAMAAVMKSQQSQKRCEHLKNDRRFSMPPTYEITTYVRI